MKSFQVFLTIKSLYRLIWTKHNYIKNNKIYNKSLSIYAFKILVRLTDSIYLIFCLFSIIVYIMSYGNNNK